MLIFQGMMFALCVTSLNNWLDVIYNKFVGPKDLQIYRELQIKDDEPIGCTIHDPGSDYVPPRNFCHGFAEIRTEFNGIETVHGRIIKHEGEDAPKKASILRYRAPGGRNARKIIEVQGDCCWKFYKGFRYRGSLKSVRNSGLITPNFAPRSLKVVEC